jgi:two-component system cell cycle sensor histidine kinase/response regulator CckA
MPGMSGHKLAVSLRPNRPDIQVLYVSGHSEELVRQQGIALKKTAFLQKPFLPSALLKKVQELLDA